MINIYTESDLPIHSETDLHVHQYKQTRVPYIWIFHHIFPYNCRRFLSQVAFPHPGQRMMLLRCLVLLLTLLIGQISGYGRGAPDWTCSSKMPSHGGVAQTSPATDYQITTSASTYMPGGSITGTY